MTFCLLPLLGFAQEDPKKYIQLGFTGSPNIGWLRISDERTPGLASDGPRAGFSYGVLADFGFATNYYFSTAFTVTSINGKSNFTASNTGPASDAADFTYKIQYIEVPLTLKLKSNDTAPVRFYGQFGLGTGVRIGAKLDFTRRNADGMTTGSNVNISDEVNTLRFSLIAGGGTEWKIANDLSLLTGISLNSGFTNTLDGNDDVRNTYLALNLGIYF